MHKDIIFWDWNGTLLDDVLVCIDCMNGMLRKRRMQEIDQNFYKTIFNFPVRDYYERLGFDFSIDKFEDLSIEFISSYNSRVKDAALQSSALKALRFFEKQKKKQIIISAMEQQMLDKLLELHQIRHYFGDVVGLSDIYANGKVELAEKYISDNNINPERAIFIGDTLHDAEVAEALEIELILVSNGHHSKERLSINGYQIIDDLEEIL
jgi:phosphoglycolate phosphatase